MSSLRPESTYLMLNSLINTKINKRVDNQLSIHGLSFTEYMIMHHLNKAHLNTMRRVELAECVAITASGVTRLLAPMEKIGIVEKEVNPRDARVSLVKLTSAGRKLYKNASVSVDYFATSLLSELSENQLDKLSELTKKLVL